MPSSPQTVPVTPPPAAARAAVDPASAAPQAVAFVHARAIFARVNRDARHWQIAALSTLFVLSQVYSDFGATLWALPCAVAGAMAAQALGTLRVAGGLGGFWRQFQWKSALITALSLSILLRAAEPWVWCAAGAIGVGAKFLIRLRGKHVFNPACIGIVAMSLLLGTDAWVSPGQWGQAPLFAAFAIGAAALVLSSAKRLDIALGFLASFAAVLLARAVYLGDPLVIPLHQMQSGALLVFAFFMITDPRSTPDSRIGRLIFATSVAVLAAWLGWHYHLRGAMLYALAAMAPLTCLLDLALPQRRFEWVRQAPMQSIHQSARDSTRDPTTEANPHAP